MTSTPRLSQRPPASPKPPAQKMSLAFAVIVWMTEALDYAVSAIVIAALMALLLGLAPNPANPKVLFGTSAGLSLAASAQNIVAIGFIEKTLQKSITWLGFIGPAPFGILMSIARYFVMTHDASRSDRHSRRPRSNPQGAGRTWTAGSALSKRRPPPQREPPQLTGSLPDESTSR
jgi:hypothetical protein